MTELSNAVTVLIARMESHPEDFNTVRLGRAKFRSVAEALYGLVGMDKERAGSYWFLTDADKEALIEAWKKYHRTEMEKEVMETIFDDGEGELAKVEMQLEISRQKALMQNAIMQSTGTFGGGQITSIPNPAQNAALGHSNNTGLFGGIFK